MLSKELLKKVQLIEITTRKLVDDVLAGQYRSRFKGQGVQFSEHRLYVPGDDVRHIDWKVSARSRDPLVKKYEEEREVPVFLVVDVSGSEVFGSGQKLKSEVVAEVGGMLTYAASRTGDRVGVLLFASGVEKVIPPKKGKQHVLRIIQDLLTYSAQTQGTDLKGALQSAYRIMKHRGIVFVISDFIAKDYDVALKKLASKHDVVLISIGDEKEEAIPDIGQILFIDPESGTEQMVDTSSYSFKNWFKSFRSELEAEKKMAFKGMHLDVLKISTQENYGDAVVRFFRTRSRRK